MKLLLVSQHFWPEAFRINDVAASLQAAGVEVTVLTGQPNYPAGTVFDGYRAASSGIEHHRGVEIHRVPLVPRGHGSAVRLTANYLSFIVSAGLVGSWRLRGRRFDAVFVYGTSPILQALAAILLAHLKGAALVTWVQDLWPQSLQATGYVTRPRLLAAVASVVRWIYARNDLLLLQSPAFEAPVRELAPPSLPLRVHPNPGEDPADGPLPPCPLTLGPGFHVVFAGNLGTAQALGTVLDAADLLRDLPDLRFVLVGSGQRSAWLDDEIRRRGLANVDLPGRLPAEAMPGLFAQADALLVTLARNPALAQVVPSKLQSYLAAGRPVVAALDGESARVVIEAGAGLACGAEDAPALAAALRRVHAMPPAERAALGAAGRRYHDTHFSPRHLTPALIAHLEGAIRDHAARAATIRTG